MSTTKRFILGFLAGVVGGFVLVTVLALTVSAQISGGGTSGGTTGGDAFVYTAKSADYTGVANDWVGMTGAHTVTLPACSSNANKAVAISDVDAATSTTVGKTGGDTVQGGTTFTMNPGDSFVFRCDGTSAWRAF